MTDRDDTATLPVRFGAEMAAEYVLGILTGPERVAFERQLATDATLQRAVGFWSDKIQALSDTVDAVQPSADLWGSVEAAIGGSPPPGSVTVRANEGQWVEILDGVFKKTLLVDEAEGAESFLLRLNPGAVCPAHSHSKTEECLMLEGEMIIGEARFRAGDYHAAPPNIAHLSITSKTGALLYVRGELHP